MEGLGLHVRTLRKCTVCPACNNESPRTEDPLILSSCFAFGVFWFGVLYLFFCVWGLEVWVDCWLVRAASVPPKRCLIRELFIPPQIALNTEYSEY